MTYEWKIGSRLTADAQAVGIRLEQLRALHGGHLTAKAVVRDGRRPGSPLEPCFEWDDSRAAEKFREEQARYVLRSIVQVERETDDSEPKTFRAFVVVTEGEDEHYTAVTDAMRDPALRQQILQRAFRELDQWRERYREYEELAAVFVAADAARERVA